VDEIRRINLQLFAADSDTGGQEPQDEPVAGTADDGDPEPGDGGRDLDPAALRRELERARKEAAKYRTERKQWQDQLQQLRDTVAKALGIKDDKEIEADKLAGELQQLKARYRQERLRGAFWRLADKLGADGELAYAYLYAAGDLDDLDVDAEDFEELLGQRIQSAIKANAKLRKDAPPAGKSGAEFGGGGDGTLTLDQIRAMTPEQINANWDRIQKVLESQRR